MVRRPAADCPPVHTILIQPYWDLDSAWSQTWDFSPGMKAAVCGQYDHERQCLESCGLLLKTSSSQLSPQTLFLPHHISKSYTHFKSSSISIFLRRFPGSLQSMWYQCSSLFPEHWQFMKFCWSFLALLVSFFRDVVLVSSSPWLNSPGLGLYLCHVGFHQPSRDPSLTNYMKGCEAPWTLWTLKWFQVARTTSFGVKNRFLGSGGRTQGKGYSRNKRGILDGGVVVCEGGCRERHLSGCPVHQENQSLWQNKSKLIFLGLGSSGQTIWGSLELSLFPLGVFFLPSVDILPK